MTTTNRRGRPRADAARDLRADLLRTARALLDEGGASALSLREVARRAGCTHQAPYHYFADRESLLAALVAAGFDTLTERLAAANGLCASQGPRSTLIAASDAYISFALSQPGVFRIMFRSDMCAPERFPGVLEASLCAHGELERLNHLVRGPDATPAQESILWAHVHGLACLLLDGPLGLMLQDPGARQAHLQAVAGAFADNFLAA